MKKWNLLSNYQLSMINDQNNKQTDKILSILLENRGLTSTQDIQTFLNPKLEDVTPSAVGLDFPQLEKAIQRIEKAIKEKEQIVIYGDYDVDGITGTAILWESLHHLGAKVAPYIPHRVDEGYGLSVKGIENIMEKILRLPSVAQDDKGGLIITVDNGIVANEAVEFANKNDIDVIITDHHTTSEKLPNAYAIVHTTQLCGAAVAWLVSQEISKDTKQYLDLVALATVADLVPLTGANRTLLKFGLEELRHTKRLGLRALFQEAQITSSTIGPYEIGHMIGPRLNAMGRLESAMDSLRLLCTKNPLQAQQLAHVLSETNKGRQLLTQAATLHAIEYVKRETRNGKRILFVVSNYEEGVIGLVAGKLVEQFYLPAIVVSKGEKVSKGSARSVSGFNIIEIIRTHTHLLINAGGHPMAAGFTIVNENIVLFQEALQKSADGSLTDDHITRKLNIDMELPIEMVTVDLHNQIQQLAPFGMNNPQPIFLSKNVSVEEIRTMGKDNKHLKLGLMIKDERLKIDAVGFGMGEFIRKIKPGQNIDIVYAIDENEWNGKKSLQLKLKDIETS